MNNHDPDRPDPLQVFHSLDTLIAQSKLNAHYLRIAVILLFLLTISSWVIVIFMMVK